ncbi:MAG: hypothetical protein ABGY75_21595, partial [Gemmataceae bacterium]
NSAASWGTGCGGGVTMFVVNLGGEGEVVGALNQQGPWALNSSWFSSRDGKPLAQLVADGHGFLICPNDAIALPDGCCRRGPHQRRADRPHGVSWVGGAVIGDSAYPEVGRELVRQRVFALDQTLTSFADLLRPDLSISVGEQQQRASDALPDMVSRSHLSWLAQPESLNGTGDKLVVGVAVWSLLDLKLLDELDQHVEANPGVRVYVFDVDRVGGDFDLLVPGVGDVLHTPVVGRWVGGVLTQSGSGYAGRRIVHELIHPSRVANS